MIGFDTNLLVRHFTHDDPAQVVVVTAVFDKTRRRGETIYVSLVVLCELHWVLTTIYGLERLDVIDTVRALLDDPLFSVEHPSETEAALASYIALGGDFPDHLIGSLAESAGAVTTYTFDKKAAKLPGFTLLK